MDAAFEERRLAEVKRVEKGEGAPWATRTKSRASWMASRSHQEPESTGASGRCIRGAPWASMKSSWERVTALTEPESTDSLGLSLVHTGTYAGVLDWRG